MQAIADPVAVVRGDHLLAETLPLMGNIQISFPHLIKKFIEKSLAGRHPSYVGEYSNILSKFDYKIFE